MPRSTLSIAIVTLNEAGNLERTLASVRFADEIVVVDSGSTDGTPEIVSEYPVGLHRIPPEEFHHARTRN